MTWRWLHYRENVTEMSYPFQGGKVLNQRHSAFWEIQFDETRLKMNSARPLGRWFRRWQALILLSLAFFTQCVRSWNTSHGCHTHWPRETNSSPPPLFPVYSLETKLHLDTMKELGLKLLPLPSYTSDLAYSYYHIFRSSSNNLGVSFNNAVELEICSMIFSGQSLVITIVKAFRRS